jgi:hypothetical protein
MYLPHWIPKELKGLDYIKHSICKRLNIQSNSIRVRFLAEIFWSLCCLLIFNIRTLITPLVSSNSSFNNFSIISWRSVLSVVETGVSVENQRPDASH